jgi:hypothetical protein
MDYNFDVKLVSGTGRWVVEIDSQANYGYFENTVNERAKAGYGSMVKP